MEIYTDLAGEIFKPQQGTVPEGVTYKSKSKGDISILRLDVAKAGLARPRGVYITIELPNFSYIDDKNEVYTNTVAAELATMLPKNGPVLVVGLGNRAVTADSLGPKTVDGIFVTRGLGEAPPQISLRQVAAFAAEVEGKTGIEAAEQIKALVETLKPAAVICIDALCAADEGRLGCTVQMTDTGITPGSGVGAHKHALTQRTLGVPVIALGVPTVMDAAALCGGQKSLIVAPKEIDYIIKRAANVLALAVNRALQTGLSFGEISYLTS